LGVVVGGGLTGVEESEAEKWARSFQDGLVTDWTGNEKRSIEGALTVDWGSTTGEETSALYRTGRKEDERGGLGGSNILIRPSLSLFDGDMSPCSTGAPSPLVGP
jgi:hypothetical protein